MLSSSSPADRALSSHRPRSRRSGSCAASEESARVRVTKVPTPGRAATSPVVLQLAVGLEDGVRVDRKARHHVLDGGQLVALDQQAEAQGPPYLMDDLEVRSDPGAGVQRELDHEDPFI